MDEKVLYIKFEIFAQTVFLIIFHYELHHGVANVIKRSDQWIQYILLRKNNELIRSTFAYYVIYD